jgi:hypothetical protein
MASARRAKDLEFRLRAKRWHTVAVHFGLKPKRYDLSVWSPRKCRWRRIGLLPGLGEFRQEGSVIVFNGVLQVQSPESRTLIRREYK